MTAITARDVEEAKGEIVIGPRDVVTPLARDRARELNVRITVRADAAPGKPAPAVRPPPAAASPPAARTPAPGPPAAEPPAPPSGALYRRGAPVAPGTAAAATGQRMDRRPRAAVVGAGHVGGMTALRLAESNLFSRVILTDIVPGLAAGIALDMWHSAGLRKFTTRVEGSAEMEALAGADYIVVTAGRPRQPGMSRTDLTGVNADIIRQVGAAIRRHAPAAVVVVVTNPLEEMTHLMAQATGFPPRRVLGMAGLLDSARFCALVAMTGVAAPDEVHAHALGSHGPEMVIPLSQASANGAPLEGLLPPEALAAIVERTRESGAEVVKLLQKGSAYFAPAESAAAMVQAMVRESAEVMAACVQSGGAYRIADTRVGLPVRLQRDGIAEIVELALRPDEQQALKEAAERIAERIRELDAAPAPAR